VAFIEHLAQAISIVLAALTFGVFWGPWIALTRSMSTLSPDTFLAVVHRLDTNLAGLMTVLFPVTLLSIVAVGTLSVGQPAFYGAAVALAAFGVALLVTLRVEVPIVARIRTWSAGTMPGNWQAQRDRWVSFHLARVIPGFLGLAALVVGSIA